MKPQLVIGLGNPLMGDDGAGCEAAERLAADPRLPETAEVICGGTDLLRYAGQIEGRSRVIVIDAIQEDTEPGRVASAHQLSALEAIDLLRMTTPVPVPFLLIGVPVRSARMSPALSPAVEAAMPEILRRVLRELESPALCTASKSDVIVL